MTQRIGYAKAGERLSARYINRIVDGANLAIRKLRPPRSLKLGESASNDIETDDAGSGELTGVGTGVYIENWRRTSTVTITDPNDSSVSVDVDRIDEVTLVAGDNAITLRFNNT